MQSHKTIKSSKYRIKSVQVKAIQVCLKGKKRSEAMFYWNGKVKKCNIKNKVQKTKINKTIVVVGASLLKKVGYIIHFYQLVFEK